MSKLIEQVAKEILPKYLTDIFTSGDLSIIHEIYDECVKRGMKPCKNFGKGPHPIDVRKRIIKGMKTGYYFKYGWFPESITRRMSWFQLKENCRSK